MREILFKGYSPYFNKWITGLLVKKQTLIEPPDYPEEFWIATGNDDEAFAVDEESIGIFTGLYDKNNNKIFEGDIVKYKCETRNPKEENCIIMYNTREAGFVYKDAKLNISRMSWLDTKRIEVIGNIYTINQKLKS